MLPSEFFALVPEFEPSKLGLPDVGLDEDERAIALVLALQEAARLDYELLTGQREVPATPTTQQERKLREVFRLFLVAAVQRAKKQEMSLNVVKIHNPDIVQNTAFNLDLLRVIGRAERGTRQEARKLWRGGSWLTRLVGRA